MNKQDVFKDNMSASSSNSVSNNKYAENTMRIIKENKIKLLLEAEKVDSEYFKLLKKKEDLSALLMEKENSLLKEKADLEHLSDTLRECKQQERLQTQSKEINGKLSQKLFEFDLKKNPDATVSINLMNNLAITGTLRNNKGYMISSINDKCDNGFNEILEKEYTKDPDLVLLYAAFNLV